MMLPAMLFARALLAFLVLPGTVAFLVPLLWLAPADRSSFDPLGAIPVTLGIALLLWCVEEFYTRGKGTLAPWAPPTELVVTGLYRFSRNPMYVAVSLILWGWALGYRSRVLAVYALVVMAMFYGRVVFFEEPWLTERHGEKYIRYKHQVPRWLGAPREPR